MEVFFPFSSSLATKSQKYDFQIHLKKHEHMMGPRWCFPIFYTQNKAFTVKKNSGHSQLCQKQKNDIYLSLHINKQKVLNFKQASQLLTFI